MREWIIRRDNMVFEMYASSKQSPPFKQEKQPNDAPKSHPTNTEARSCTKNLPLERRCGEKHKNKRKNKNSIPVWGERPETTKTTTTNESRLSALEKKK